ncbi:unnamed protein product [Rotaria sp. Silwood1]|nr:unnamed protein product [Rotaria sp. Silwood1]CAF0858739.1 unnamed protein product [Rotaria sp. Silwood1]CAF0874183.1 unnamed protein product [Rotaria sp. Silwood1]CAF3355015.1 unnamed protein product [Rotaria sp. Silwood1]CAF3378665.1 unnamed protein product [Rotaria sp. Silwood1]
MVKLLVFAILLASSPATGLIETLFRTENSCYSGCHTNYAASTKHLNACRKGCDFKLHNEDCATQCKSNSKEEEMQACCQVGCTLSRPVDENKPIVAVDPVPETNELGPVPPKIELGRPRSIILIRLRQRPSGELPSMPMPSMQQFFNSDPIQMFNDIIKQFQDRANNFEQTIRKSFEENSKEIPKLPGFETLSELPKNIPIIRIPINNNPDSSSEENNDKVPLINEFRNFIRHPYEHHQRMEPTPNRFQQFMTDVRTEWNDLVRKQPKIPIWIFLAIFLSSSAILWYMVMSLCHHTPTRNALSIRAQELVFHPYDYEAYEKEKIQPDDQPYEVTESLPIKVKLSNI